MNISDLSVGDNIGSWYKIGTPNKLGLVQAMWQKLQMWGEALSNWVSKPDQESSDYVNLAPTDKADPSGIYSRALLCATNDKDVFNIALTGPYGSGKSSIIKTFLKEHKKARSAKRPVLQISLAAFLPEAILSEGRVGEQEIERGIPQKAVLTESRVSKQEIERSILQQMLYGADANDLPLSRFKRIQAPKLWAPLYSLFVIAGLSACWYLLQKSTAIVDGSFFQPLDRSNWFNLGCFAVGFVFVWRVLHQIYVKSFGVSLKSISLKDIEITPETAQEESILNRHLDEIIYFFQSTQYDLVVIEDLDRFNNPEIFVTLREINSLVNANAGVKRQIRFLYALRDSMFATTDRTKFFEFIVPVIPIINSSNSIDKVLEQGERLSLEERLDGQFLREVSRYLDDLRLIRNIFNEYAIYIKNLEEDEENVLDPNKLLAVLIYKNVLPSDFEALHRGKGKLADILSKHDALIANAESRYKSEISDLERQIADADKQVPADLNELRMIYAAALISKIPQGYIFIEHNGNRSIPIQSLSGFEDFDQIVEAQTIFCRSQNQRTQVNLASFQSEVSQIKSYSERKAEIEAKSQLFKDKTSKTVRELRGKIVTLRTKKFNEIIRADAKGNESLFDAFGESRELIRFLILEGFLDDTYYQYTSLFHSGRLSPNDNKFLIQIRAHNSPEPNFQIDNPTEVIAAMREDDFIRSFVLNVILVDCLLKEPTEHRQKIDGLVQYVSSNFQDCGEFFSTYYERGKCLPEFTSLLVQNWQGFISTALASSDCVTHVARLIAHLPEDQLKSLHDFDDDVSEFISEHLSEILALDIDFAPERLALLAFEVQDLTSMEPYPAVASLLTNEGMYTVSIANLDFAFCSVLGLPVEGSLKSKHYSTVLRSGNSALIDKVESEFDQYLTDVLLALDGNIDEDVSTIVRVLNHDEIEAERLELFLEKQATKLPSLDNIPLRLHAPAFRLKKVETTWKNCLAFLNGEAFDAATLTDYLADQHIQGELCAAAIDGGDEARPLRQFLLNNNDLQAGAYRAYVQALPKKFNAFPDSVDAEKLLILIDEDKITFSESTFSALGDHPEYQAQFIAMNIEKFLPMRGKFSIDDDFRERLLGADITDSQRLEIVRDMDLTSLGSLPSRASTIGALYHRTDADVSRLPGEAAQAMIIRTNPISAQIGLLNKCRNLLTNEQVQQVLQQLPSPFPDFRPNYGRPTIPKTEVNIELVDWLVARKIISSWKETFFGDEIRIHNFRP